MSSIAATMPTDSNTKLSLRSIAWLVALLTPLACGPIWMTAFSTSTDRPPSTTLIGFVVVAAALAASYTDARWRLIPNWVTYSAALWGVGINAYATWAPDAAEQLGAVGLGASLTGLFLLFTLLLVVFSFTGGGAGDVKLAGAMGALLGFELGAEALLYAFLAAGLWVVGWSMVHVGPIAMTKIFGRKLGGALLPSWFGPLTENDRRILTTGIPLGPFFAIGMLTVVTGLNHSIERLLFGG